MASPNQDKIVLLTGVNSYFASGVANHLLENGYTIRGTVRAREKADRFINGPWKKYGARVQIYEVPDITVPDAWNESVKGVSAIIHSAGPVITPAITKPSEIIDPIVQSTSHLLHAALHHAGPLLSLFAFTSSVAAAITPDQQPPHTYTEASWNTVAPAIIARDGDAASVWHAYPVAKFRAEKTCFAFRDEHAPPFAITTLLGSIATGPPVLAPDSPEGLPMTLRPVYNALIGRNLPSAQDHIAKIAGAAPFSDIRDVAACYRWCIEHPEQADGERWMIVAGHGAKQALLDVLREEYPDRGVPEEETRGVGYRADYQFKEDGVRFDSSKVQSRMGITWRGYRESLVDTAEALRGLWEGVPVEGTQKVEKE